MGGGWDKEVKGAEKYKLPVIKLVVGCQERHRECSQKYRKNMPGAEGYQTHPGDHFVKYRNI